MVNVDLLDYSVSQKAADTLSFLLQEYDSNEGDVPSYRVIKLTLLYELDDQKDYERCHRLLGIQLNVVVQENKRIRNRAREGNEIWSWNIMRNVYVKGEEDSVVFSKWI